MTVKVTGIEQVNYILANSAPREAVNLLRATTYDIAKTAAVIAQAYTPDDPSTGIGDLKSSIKAKREKGSRYRLLASVIVTNIRRNFFWRFLEYGQGPDHVEHAMFAKTIQSMKPSLVPIFLKAFGAKLENRLRRK